jgi:hypothetical protein
MNRRSPFFSREHTPLSVTDPKADLNVRVTILFEFVPEVAKHAIHRFGKCMVLAVRKPSLRKTEIVSFGVGAICQCCQHFAFGSTILAHQDGGTRSAEHSAPPCLGIEATVAPRCHCASQPYAVCAILNTFKNGKDDNGLGWGYPSVP